MKKTLLTALLIAGVNFCANAQAYDGGEDGKIFLGYANVGGKSGIEAQIDRGISDLISYGGKFSFLIKPHDPKETSNTEEDMEPFDTMDFAIFLRFHFSEALNLNERIDPFLSLEGGLKSAGVNAGIKYNFTETIGVFAMYNHSLSSSFYGDTEIIDDEMSIFTDKLNYFGKKSTISFGLTFNVY